MSDALRIIVSTRLEPDMMQQVNSIIRDTGKTRGDVLRGLIHAGLLMRHSFSESFYNGRAGQFCDKCFQPEAHVIHLTEREIKDFAKFLKEQGIATRG